MLILIILFYVLPVYLVFFRFKWLPLTRMWKIILPLPPIFALIFVWYAVGRFTPISQDAYIQAPVVQIAPQVAGLVTEILVEDNAMVNQGDPLFRIDTSPYQYRADQARARMFEARENALGLVATVYAANASVTRAAASLEVARQGVNNAEADLAASQANVAKTKAQVQLADAEAERGSRLVQSQAISQQEYEELLRNQQVQQSGLDEAMQREAKAKTGIEMATSQVTVADAALREANAQRDKVLSLLDPVRALHNAIAASESDLLLELVRQSTGDAVGNHARNETIKQDIALLRSYLAEAEKLAPLLEGKVAAVVQAESALKIAEFDLDQTTIRSPISGQIVNLHLTNGTYVTPGKAVSALLDTNSWHLVVTMPENWLSHVRVGDDVTIALRNYPLSFRDGKVIYIVPGAISGQGVPTGALPDPQSRLGRQFDTPETSQQFQVIVSLADDRPEQPLRVGGTGHAVIFAGGGLAGMNQVATLLCTIASFMDFFFPKPPLLTILIVVVLILFAIALTRYITHARNSDD
jgi:multidrug resistance efflux pump